MMLLDNIKKNDPPNKPHSIKNDSIFQTIPPNRII
jgi:hypothetical protein